MRIARLRKLDWIMLAAIILLAALGLVIIYSTTLSSGEIFTRVQKQLLSFILGLIAFTLFLFIDYRLFRNYALPMYIGTFVLLVAVLILGVDIRGSQSWFDLGFYRLQPSELGKFAMVILLAKFFADHRRERKMLKSVILSGVYTAIPVGLILLEPDLGTALVYIGLWFGMLLASGMRLRHFLLLVLMGVLVSVFAWTTLFDTIQKERILVFVDPNRAPLEEGYNVRQSQIAIGSGGILGKGLGQGSQSQLQFLPEQQTDFIFAATAEELGLAGSVFLLTLLTVLIARIIWVAKVSRDDFGMFIAFGVASILIIQVVVNVGMNLGIMPVTGIPLPLVSYGGSSVLATMALLGLVEGVYLRHRTIDFKA